MTTEYVKKDDVVNACRKALKLISEDWYEEERETNKPNWNTVFSQAEGAFAVISEIMSLPIEEIENE